MGENGDVSTIYNVGKIKKDSMPNRKIISAIGSKADILSNDIIPKTIKSVKQNLSENDTEQKQKQLDIINETNPAPNTYSTWIRSVDDIKTLAETLEDDEWDYEEFNPNLTREDIQNAIESGEITVYSSYPIENGVFVSPSRMEAESCSGNGNVYEKTVDINDVAWIDPTQGQYAKVDNGQVFSRKQTDPIQAHYAEVMRENRNLKNIISALDEMQYSSARSNIHLDGRVIHSIAGRLLRNASSKYDKEQLTVRLTALFDYMANSNGVVWEEVMMKSSEEIA